jgi:hypothetical protein
MRLSVVIPSRGVVWKLSTVRSIQCFPAIGKLLSRASTGLSGMACSGLHPFAHLVDRAVHSLQPLFILTAMAGWTVAATGQISAYRSRKPGSPRPISATFIVGLLIFAGIIGGEVAIAGFLKSTALAEVEPKLVANIETVSVNGAPFDNPDGLLAALRSMHDTMAHHSSPTTGSRLFLTTSQGPLELQMCRDSQDPHEYWVFYPRFYSTKTNDIGHVFTNALDGR